MPKNRRRKKNEIKQERQDLSYKKALEVVYMDQKEMQLAYEQYALILREINEEIEKNMKRYNEAQRELIKLKLQQPSLDAVNKSINDIRERYKDILLRYEN